jgi:hypothetical protein
MIKSLISLMKWFAEREEQERKRQTLEDQNVFTIDQSQLPHYQRTLADWEAEIAAKDGNLDLGDKERLRTLVPSERKSTFGRFDRVFSTNGLTERKTLQEILNRYSRLPEATSLAVSSPEELEEHVRRIHAISYAHYVFGAHKNLIGTFPRKCCNISAENVLLAQMKEGYPMATFIERSQIHSYNAMPFVLNKTTKGVIVTDPTSDQLWPSLKKNQPRNLTFVVQGDTWRYLTEFALKEDLYPDQLITLKQLRELPRDRMYKLTDKLGFRTTSIASDAKREQEPKEYFRRAFENPIKVTL